jgi:hypothetical protein
MFQWNLLIWRKYFSGAEPYNLSWKLRLKINDELGLGGLRHPSGLSSLGASKLSQCVARIKG